MENADEENDEEVSGSENEDNEQEKCSREGEPKMKE
jgi:hypothetical protein